MLQRRSASGCLRADLVQQLHVQAHRLAHRAVAGVVRVQVPPTIDGCAELLLANRVVLHDGQAEVRLAFLLFPVFERLGHPAAARARAAVRIELGSLPLEEAIAEPVDVDAVEVSGDLLRRLLEEHAFVDRRDHETAAGRVGKLPDRCVTLVPIFDAGSTMAVTPEAQHLLGADFDGRPRPLRRLCGGGLIVTSCEAITPRNAPVGTSISRWRAVDRDRALGAQDLVFGREVSRVLSPTSSARWRASHPRCPSSGTPPC